MPANLRGPTKTWASMTHDERGRYMHDSVLPAMRTLFQAYDSHAYSRFDCATCHGANARHVAFHMPNTLPTLFRFGSPQQEQQVRDHPRVVAFMAERLVPAMAQLLGEQPFNPQTHQGFGCYNCHPHEN